MSATHLKAGATLLTTAVLVGALGAWTAYSFENTGNDEEGGSLRTRAFRLLQLYPNIAADSSLLVALQEPAHLFFQVDANATRHLLDSLELLVSTFSKLAQGSQKPAEVATALRARREASTRLHALVRKARRKKPLLACEMDEDLQTLKTCMDGYIHNCLQQSSLNLMERLS